MGRLPDFIIVGGMRCGSTTLYRLLDAHPDVHMATPKELHFFDQEFSRGVDWYRQHFATARESQVCGEATPSYMYNREAVDRICRTSPGSTCITILRHPAERAYSHYWMNRALGRETRDFSEALRQEEERARRGEGWGRYIGMSRYWQALSRLESLVGREALAVVILEEFQEDPNNAWSSLCEQLGIAVTQLDLAMASTPLNAFQLYRSMRLRRWTKRLPKAARDAVGRVNRRNATYPPLTPEDRRVLWSHLDDDARRLEAWLGRPIHHWHEPARSS